MLDAKKNSGRISRLRTQTRSECLLDLKNLPCLFMSTCQFQPYYCRGYSGGSLYFRDEVHEVNRCGFLTLQTVASNLLHDKPQAT
jgi:hypothetical protein